MTILHNYQKLCAGRRASKWYLTLSIEALVSYILHCYWNLLVKKKDGLLNVTSSSSHEIDSRCLAILKIVRSSTKSYIVLQDLYNQRSKDIDTEVGNQKLVNAEVGDHWLGDQIQRFKVQIRKSWIIKLGLKLEDK